MNPFIALLDLFLPRECHICGQRLLGDEEFICRQCVDKLPSTGYEKYWTNTHGINTDLNPMEQRFAGQLPLNHACAPFFYMRDSSLASLIHDFKYRGFSRLATHLGYIGAQRLKDSDLFQGVDVLIPVPLHWTKRLRRGYNQTELIAEGVSRATSIPISRDLQAIKSHRTQTALSSQQRIDNTKGIFRLKNAPDYADKTIMLVDDICTTGATLLSAGEAVAASSSNIRLSIFTLGVV